MSADAKPQILTLGGEENFYLYDREFRRLYHTDVRIMDVLGNHVIFEKASCWHVCFKRDEEDQSARRSRNIWSQERAAHIPWIMAALKDNSTEVRPNDHDSVRRINYLFALDGTYYIVVAERISKNSVRFVTAYPITAHDWRKYRRAGRALYPQTKKKGEQ